MNDLARVPKDSRVDCQSCAPQSVVALDIDGVLQIRLNVTAKIMTNHHPFL